MDIIAAIERLFQQRGAEAYLGEPVTQLEHALQAAWLAEQQGAGSRSIAAALLHDIGHLLSNERDDAPASTDARHEQLGYRYLRPHFDDRVLQPIRLHVAAKRFLCRQDPDYFQQLSPASRHSLQLQGGPMDAAEADQFQSQPYAELVVAVRIWDDQAKTPGLLTPPLSHFLRHLKAAAPLPDGAAEAPPATDSA